MVKTTGAAAVAEKPSDALWLAALPNPLVATRDRLPAPALPQPAEGVLSGLPAAVTEMALSRDGRLLVAAHYGADAVSVIDATDLTLRNTVDGVAEPTALAVLDRGYVISAGIAEDGVVAIDVAGGFPLATRPVRSHVRGLAVSPAGDTLYIGRCGDESADIAAITVESGALSVIEVSSAAGDTVDAVRISADGTRLYASLSGTAGDAVVVADARGRCVLQSIGCSGRISDIAVHRDGRRVFATGWDDNLGGVVFVIDTARGRVTETVVIGAPSTQLALTATHAYVLCGDEIAVINVATCQIVDTIAVGRPLACLTVSPDGTLLYIADFDGTVEARGIAGDSLLRAAS